MKRIPLTPGIAKMTPTEAKLVGLSVGDAYLVDAFAHVRKVRIRTISEGEFTRTYQNYYIPSGVVKVTSYLRKGLPIVWAVRTDGMTTISRVADIDPRGVLAVNRDKVFSAGMFVALCAKE